MGQTTKLSTKGQVVLPKPLRVARRWKPGTEFIVREQGDGILLTPKSAAASRGWESLIGCAAYRGPRKSIREMDKAVAAEARKHK
jgi:AbrB family looped-hinge helix DNA binding protein